MVIGTLGDIIFQVSSETVRTFSELVHTARGRWAIHEVMNGKPRAEFLGPGLNEIAMTIILFSEFGVNPRAEFEKIGTMILQGKHAPLILGGKPMGNGDWFIEENESVFKHIDGKSEVHSIEMSVAFKEYF